MRKFITTFALAAVLPMMATTAQAESVLTPFLTEGVSIEAAVNAAMAANPELSLADALGAAMDEGASLDSVMSMALASGISQQDAVAAVTTASSSRNVPQSQVLAAAQKAGVPGDIAAAGIAQGAGTGAGGPGNGNGVGSNNGENGNGTDGAPGLNAQTPGQTGQTPANGFTPPVVPTPPANAGQDVSPV
jgi:hypothetical protein